MPGDMTKENKQILLGISSSGNKVWLNTAMANRHGLIAGATGTGKTVTLQILAEGFSRLGVPVFTADAKGDLSGLAAEGKKNEKIAQRITAIGITEFETRRCPVVFWDMFANKGHSVRATISEMGPILLAHILDLNETQAGVLHAGFSFADDEGLLLLDLKDLRELLSWIGENRSELRSKYGNIAPQSVGAIQRKLLVLSEAGGDAFFGEPCLSLEHLMQTDFSGNGVISILDAQTLMSNPRVYTTFLLWLLSELFEQLEEVGDQALPRLVFFFDEAHLLFKGAPKTLLEKIEQVVRLIRSKGVGVYFVTQNPEDIPDAVLGQLGNRIQHGLRAYTPRDQKSLRAVALSFRENPNIEVRKVVTELKVGEGLVSTLDSEGKPTPVEQVLIVPPESRIGPLEEVERRERISHSPFKNVYTETIDRESAYEILQKRREEVEESQEKEKLASRKGSSRQGFGEAFFKSLLRSVGRQVGRQIFRGILGSISGSKR